MAHVGAIRGSGRGWVEEATGARAITAFLGSVYARDEFDSGTQIVGRTPNEGSGTWAQANGSDPGLIAAGQASVAAGGGNNFYRLDAGVADYSISATIFGTVNTVGSGICARMSTTASSAGRVDIRVNAGAVAVFVDGTNQTLDATPSFVAQGNWYAVEIIVSGSNAWCFANGTLIKTVTGLTNTSETGMGMVFVPSATQGTTAVENFYVTQRPSCPGAIGEASLSGATLTNINAALSLSPQAAGATVTVRSRWGRVGAVTALLETGAAITHNLALATDTVTPSASQAASVVHQNNEIGYGTATFAYTSTFLVGGAARMGMFVPAAARTVDGAVQDWVLTTYQEPTANPAAGITTAWGQGYIVASSTVSSVSSVSSPRAYPDVISPNFVAAHQPIRAAATPTLALKQGAATRASAAATWSVATATATSLDTIDNTYTNGSAGVGLVQTAAGLFNSDPVYVWTSVPAGFRITTTGFESWDGSTVDSYFTADPRFHLGLFGSDPGGGVLFHTQGQGQSFLDPPTSGDDATGQRVFPFIAYLSVRYVNARGEGVNGLTVTLKAWNADGVGGASESTPDITFSGTTATRPDPPPTPTSPQSGWLPLAGSGTDENKLPLTWDTVVAGTTRVKSVVTAPSNATGLEIYAASGGGSFWNRNVFFIVTNPNFSAVISIHPEEITHHGSHLTPEDELIPVVYLVDHSLNMVVDLNEANGDTVTIVIVREHHPTMRMDYFDFTTEEWVGKVNGGTFASELALIRGDAHASSLGTGDPDIWTTATHLGGEIFAPDGVAGELDCMIIADIVKDGVHYTAFAPVILVGTGNKHNSYALDAVGLGLTGGITFK